MDAHFHLGSMMKLKEKTMFAMVTFFYWIFMVQTWNIIQCIFKANYVWNFEGDAMWKNVI
jgi:hypothetical protein